MGIVAGNATDAGGVADKTFAQRHAVRLEADESWTVPAITHDSVEGAMALAAEAGDLLGVETLQRGRKSLEVVSCRIGHMLL